MTRARLERCRVRLAGLALGGVLLAAALAHPVPGQDAGMVLR